MKAKHLIIAHWTCYFLVIALMTVFAPPRATVIVAISTGFLIMVSTIGFLKYGRS